MLQTQLVRLLSTLNQEELNRFGEYLNCSLFNLHNETLALFNVLVRFFPDFSDEELEPNKVYEQIYPGQPFNDLHLRTLRKYLLQRLNHFLAYQEWNSDPFEVQMSLLSSLEKRKEPKLLEKQYLRGKQMLESSHKDGFPMFLHRYNYERSLLNYQFLYSKRKHLPDSKDLHQYLDWFYLGTKLMMVVSSLNNSLVLHTERQSHSMESETIEYISNQVENLPSVLKGYYWAYKLLASLKPDQPDYLMLRRLLREEHSILFESDLINLYGFLITYTNQQYIRGESRFLEEMFFVYQEMLERKLLFTGNMFPVNNYKNIATIGLRIGRLAWTESFIETYKKYLPEAYREDVYAYNKAHLLLYKRDYAESLRILSLIKFLDPFYQMGAKMLQLKIFFEKEETDLFFSFSKTFQTHISRQREIPEIKKKAYINFIKFTKKIFRIKIGEKKMEASLVKDLSAINPIIEIDWLLAKVRELE